MTRTILHCDLNGFYASVALLSHPELVGEAVAVCGDPKSRHGIILAKNERAKAAGVTTGETIFQAQQKCPSLVLLPADHREYQLYSNRVNEIYQRYTDLVEPFGIDESWLDVTGSMHLFGGSGLAVADTLRTVVREELGLTISVGVSFNKIFAKLGSDYKKPDATTVITAENFRSIVWPLPVTDLLYVGRATAKILKQYGVGTIGALATFDREALVTLLGKHGQQLHDYANGTEHEPVAPAAFHAPPKSVGNGLTFYRNLQGLDDVTAGVAVLTDRVAMRLRRHGLKCTRIQIGVRDPQFKSFSRQQGLDYPTYLSRDLQCAAMDILQRAWDVYHKPIRALTITALGLVSQWDSGPQLNLFQDVGEEQEKQEKIERTMDAIREKYGRNAIGFSHAANDIGAPLDK